MRQIYILSLENSKYYVGITENIECRLQKHFSGTGSKWTQIHKPIQIFKIFPSTDIFDEDNYTKKLMYKYGIDNVRGGSYCTIELTKEQITFLQREFASADDKCFKCFEDHFTNRCTNTFPFGKYKNTPIDDVCKFDMDYVKWLSQQDIKDTKLKKILQDKCTDDYRLCIDCEVLYTKALSAIKLKNIRDKCSICEMSLVYHSIPFLRCDYCIKHNLQRSKAFVLEDGFCCSCFTKLKLPKN